MLRRGFSFAEVMFAVVILGIGFIMVAAVFPVAIKQTQATGEENSAAAAARTAATAISNMKLLANNLVYYSQATSSDLAIYPQMGVQYVPIFTPTVKNYVLPNVTTNPPLPGQTAVPPPAVMVPFTGVRWNQLQSNIVSSTDPRFSYVAFYKRENNSAVAELIVVAVANRNRPVYDSTTDVDGKPSSVMVNETAAAKTTVPPECDAKCTAIVPDTMSISPGITVSTSASNAVSPEGGSVTLTTNSFTPPATLLLAHKPVGRYYTLGRSLSAVYPGATASQFEINPGDGLALTAGTNGNWGTMGATNDTPLLNDTCTLALPSTLQPTVAYVQILAASSTNPSGTIRLCAAANSASTMAPSAAAQGAFVIIADDCPFDFRPGDYSLAQNYSIPCNTANYQVGKLNGRIFRLGAPVVQNADGSVAPSGTFQLDPAYGMQPGGTASPDTFPNPNTPDPDTGVTAAPANLTARCYIIGAGKDNNGNPTGLAQDIGVFATYIPVQ